VLQLNSPIFSRIDALHTRRKLSYGKCGHILSMLSEIPLGNEFCFVYLISATWWFFFFLLLNLRSVFRRYVFVIIE